MRDVWQVDQHFNARGMGRAFSWMFHPLRALLGWPEFVVCRRKSPCCDPKSPSLPFFFQILVQWDQREGFDPNAMIRLWMKGVVFSWVRSTTH